MHARKNEKFRAGGARHLSNAIIGSAIIASAVLLVATAGLSLRAGLQSPALIDERGLELGHVALHQFAAIGDIELDDAFWLLTPELTQVSESARYTEQHQAVWHSLQLAGQTDIPARLKTGETVNVTTQFPVAGQVLAQQGGMLMLALMFFCFGATILYRHRHAAGATAALHLFASAWFTTAVVGMVTRSVTLPPAEFALLSWAYLLSTTLFFAIIYFPFVYPLPAASAGLRRAMLTVMAGTAIMMIGGYALGLTAINTFWPLTAAAALVMLIRMAYGAVRLPKSRFRAQVAMGFTILALATLTYTTIVTNADALVRYTASFNYFVLTSFAIGIAFFALLSAETFHRDALISRARIGSLQAESAEVEERTREMVVMNLHDHVARALDSISAISLRGMMSTQQAPALENVRNQARDAHRALRGLFAISAEGCANCDDLRARLQEHGNAIVRDKGIELSVIGPDVDDSHIQLPAMLKLCCFHIFTESVSNAVRHSEAALIQVRCGVQDDQFALRVADDGKGFDPACVDNSAHFGLQHMRRRAELVLGTLAVSSRPGGGTRILFKTARSDQGHRLSTANNE